MTTIKAPPRLVLLANKLAQAKRDENVAKAKRIEAEIAIVSLLEFKKPEGQESYESTTLGGSSCRVTLKQGVNSIFDGKQWPKLRITLNQEARKAIKTDYKLDTAAARLVQEKDPSSWAAISALVTRKPAKVSVDIKLLTVEPKDDLDSASEEISPTFVRFEGTELEKED